MKRLLLFLLLSIGCKAAFSQYLLSQYRDKNVYMQIYQNLKLFSAYTGPAVYQYTANYDQNQVWQLVSTPFANWYKIYHVATGRYVTIISPTENAAVELRTEEQSTDTYQMFQFIQQTNTSRYKIHSRFSINGLALILEIPDGNTANDVSVRLGKNVTIGDAKHQKFDVSLATPPVDPSAAIASLADRFEGRTVGFSMKHNARVIRTGTTSDKIWMDWPYNVLNYASFFKLEYTNEVGWYKIKYKPTNKYVTLVSVTDGADVRLMTDAAYADDYQKFKFVIQLNDSTYKIHSKFSLGSGPSKRALVLEAPISATDSIRLKKNITVGSDQNQQFIIRRNVLAKPAQFTSGASVLGSGKILSKQYHISSQESLAMLEPYVVGADTFVRIQPTPVYGEQSEWILSPARKINGVKTFKIRYGATGQFLYMPAATDSATASLPYGLRLKLKAQVGFGADRRFEFGFNSGVNNSFTITSNVTNGNTNLQNAVINVNDDGYLATPDYSNTINFYVKSSSFFINLSMPADPSKVYCIYTKNQGHLLCDSGKINTSSTKSPITHIPYTDFSCFWYLIPSGDGSSYYIKNQLSGQFMSSYSRINAGDTVFNASTSASAATKWILERRGNYFAIRNAITNGKYLAVRNLPDEGKPIVLGSSLDAGTDWIISRADYFSQPLLPAATGSITLLSPYIPDTARNPLNAGLARDQMMRNLGLPFEPYLQTTLYNTDTALLKEGFTGNTSVSFLPVLKSALRYKFGYSAGKADSAIRNYKVDVVAHRVQMVYALRAYLLDSLPKVSRNIWTTNEKALASWLEGKILRNRTGYADRLNKSWTDFKNQSTAFGSGQLSFDFVYNFDVPDYEAFVDPEYIKLTNENSVSLLEYESTCAQFGYKNPGALAFSPINMVSNAASNLAGAVTFPNEFLELNNANAQQARDIIDNNLSMVSNVLNATQEIVDAGMEEIPLLTNIATAGGAAFPVAVVLNASITLIMAAIDESQYAKFDSAMVRKIRLLRQPISINTVMTSNNLLNRYNLTRDVDYVLGMGQRFDNSLAETFQFTGNGNWSNAANWYRGKLPPASFRPGSSIVIDPVSGGECVLDVDYTLPLGTKLNVMPGKRFRIKARLNTTALISSN